MYIWYKQISSQISLRSIAQIVNPAVKKRVALQKWGMSPEICMSMPWAFRTGYLHWQLNVAYMTGNEVTRLEFLLLRRKAPRKELSPTMSYLTQILCLGFMGCVHHFFSFCPPNFSLKSYSIVQRPRILQAQFQMLQFEMLTVSNFSQVSYSRSV